MYSSVLQCTPVYSSVLQCAPPLLNEVIALAILDSCVDHLSASGSSLCDCEPDILAAFRKLHIEEYSEDAEIGDDYARHA